MDEIISIIKRWPVDIELNKVLKWILQFDNEDIDLSMRILRNLNVMGVKDIEDSLEIAYSKLMRKAIEKGTRISSKNTIFAGMGDDGKSGSMISYHFRLINELSEENFLSDNTMKYFEEGLIENIVLVDDIISTGKQASTSIKKITEKFIPFNVKNIFVLSVCAFKDGIETVENDTKAYVFTAYEYDKEDTYGSLDAKFYDGIPYDERSAVQNRMKKYGEICMPKMPNGYGGICALIAFYYNTPNTTTPLIWSGLNGWIPLFSRVLKINGIESYYKQISKLTLKKSNEPSSVKELIIYTEGKREELLLEILISDFELCKMLDVNKVSIVTLGGNVFSQKLLEQLSKVNQNYIFVFEKHTEKNIAKYDLPNDIQIIYLQPSIMQFIDVEKLIVQFPMLIESLSMYTNDITHIDGRILDELERILFSNKRFPYGLSLEHILRECINTESYQEFIRITKRALEKTIQ